MPIKIYILVGIINKFGGCIMDNKHILEKYICDNDIEHIVSFINGNEKSDEYLKWMIDYLQSTDNTNFRNTIAIALADLKCEYAASVLAELSVKYCHTDSYASLLYALSLLNCKDYILKIIFLIYHGNFEARHNVFDILGNNINLLSKREKEDIVLNIHKYLDDCEDKMNLLIDASKLLGDS